MIVFVIIQIVLLTGLVLSIVLLRRNFKVYEYRTHLIDKISKATQTDIEKGKDWVWRFNIYNSVKYDTMVYKFWKRLSDFYPDKSFIESK